jgi:DNA-binding SARP family transcriptional activator
MSRHDDHPTMAPTSAAAPDVIEEVRRNPVAIPIVGEDEGKRRPPIEVLGGEAPALAPVIRSKIEPPQLRSSTLSRQRLLDALTAAISRRVTLLVAEAGYGKTTLLTDFSSRPITRCLWYKLDSTDQDWITLVNYLIAAAREHTPDFGHRTLSLLATDPTSIAPREAVVSSLMAELQELGGVTSTLILDDFHAIDESEEACDIVMRLVRDAPPSFSFILSSRRKPPVLLARLAGQGELSEIGMDELRFSRDEMDQLLAESYGRPLDPDVLIDIDSRTKGWAATLQLFCSSIRGRSVSAVRSLARSLSGADSPVYDFLAEEVLGHLDKPLQEFVVRAALLEQIVPEYVVALLGEGGDAPTRRQAAQWIEEADTLGILSRSSQTSESREFHPLLREFLLRQLVQRASEEDVRGMHRRVAQAAALTDPLVATHHYIEADQPRDAMRCLAASVMLTMGSGRWGTASELVSRLQDVPADPVVAAIQARRLLDEGDFVSAGAILEGIDVSAEPPAVRAVFRHTRLSLGWRQGDSEALFATLREIEEDTETPALLREIAQVFVDASPLSATPVTLPALSQRLQRMADRQARAGHTYHAAISLHNAAIAELNAGRYQEAIRIGHKALAAFDVLAFPAVERFSTHHVLAAGELELGMREAAEEDMRVALGTGTEEGDVHASCANSLAVVGDRDRATRLLLSAEALERRGRSDLQGINLTLFARAFLQLLANPQGALSILDLVPAYSPLDLGWNFDRYTIGALAHLLLGDHGKAAATAEQGISAARKSGALRGEVRLELVLALARQDPQLLRAALARAASVGDLAILQVADALAEQLGSIAEVPEEVSRSVARWRGRWLPALRRQLERGGVPSAFVAARLLDEYGTQEDVARLRAFEKTYVKRGRATGLGRGLVKRVSDPLHIRDLGRVSLHVGDRTVALSTIRRRPAALLMYLVTKPNFTAAREQVLDELWRDADPVGASNSLNQTLYFLRREIDPWYEDDLSADYVGYQGELLWLDPDLVRVASAEFLTSARTMLARAFTATDALALMTKYAGQFSPEFEYEEWAISWRLRVHASYLNVVHSAMQQLIEHSDLRGARDVALVALATDPSAADLERALIWTYARMGAASAALAQYQHLATRERADGLDPPTFEELTSGGIPPR